MRTRAVLDEGGTRRPIPMAVRHSVAERLVGALLSSGERRLRALSDGLSLAVIREDEWREDDPDGAHAPRRRHARRPD